MSFSSTSSRTIVVADTSANRFPGSSSSPRVDTDSSPAQTTNAPDLLTATVVVTSQTTLTAVSTAVITPTDTPSAQIENAPASIIKTTATAYVTVSISGSGSGSASLHASSSPSIPLILGATIGGLVALAILTFAGMYCIRKRRRKSETEIEPYPFFAPNAWASRYDSQRDLQSPASSTFPDISMRHAFYDSIGNASYLSLPSTRSSDVASLLKRDHHGSVQRPLHNLSEPLSIEPGYRDVLAQKMGTSSRQSGQVHQDQGQAAEGENDPSNSVGSGRPPTYRTN